MSGERRRQLKNELHGEVGALSDFTDDEVEKMLRLIKDAHTKERKALIRSIDETVAALPWVFRGPVRSVLFGGLK
ncbi:MAG: hypothetical protein LLG14_05290 [Nocardiaceae bacterium]|nr:hypothetical protein [Nocardiaceae bacterium]